MSKAIVNGVPGTITTHAAELPNIGLGESTRFAGQTFVPDSIKAPTLVFEFLERVTLGGELCKTYQVFEQLEHSRALVRTMHVPEGTPKEDLPRLYAELDS